MKRTGMKPRKAPLKTGTKAMRRTPLAPGTKPLKAGGELKRQAMTRTPAARSPSKPLKAPAPALRAARAAWRTIAVKGHCAVKGCGHPWVHAHHIIPLGDMKTAGVHWRYWYDPRNAICLCTDPAPERHHDRHENYVQKADGTTWHLTLATVVAGQPRIYEFADEIGLRWRLLAEYE